ncbi:hypothetical protein BT93_C1224 [Corymbia citriodora subsp. variegata]|nr:hypothetical protein BT93_C1224 [Corymbia citriodora subsp. variegata]
MRASLSTIQQTLTPELEPWLEQLLQPGLELLLPLHEHNPDIRRIMQEGSSSSPAGEADELSIEEFLLFATSAATNTNSAPIGLGFRSPAVPAASPPRNLDSNPRLQLQLQQQQQLGNSTQQRGEEVRRVIDILLRPKKRNPVLVGESGPETLVKELLKRIENKELGDGLLKNIQVVLLDKEIGSDEAKMPTKFQELGDVLETMMGNSGGGGVVLHLGDLKWLVEQPAAVYGPRTVQPQEQLGRIMVAELGKLLARFEKSSSRLWLIGTATPETCLRCQVYHRSMEIDWDLQAVPIAATAPQPLPGLFSRKRYGGSMMSIEAHLAGAEGHGIRGCEIVPDEVRLETRKASKVKRAVKSSNNQGNVEEGPDLPVTVNNEDAQRGTFFAAMPYLSSDVISTVGASSSSLLPIHPMNFPSEFNAVRLNNFVDLSLATGQEDLARKALTNMSCLVNAEVEEPNTEVPQGNEGSIDNVRSKGDELMKLNKLPDGGIGWRKIGKILVSRKEIGEGSNGTIVFEGIYEERLVAVKRLVLEAGCGKASNEIQTLINSDRHENIVRYYGVEADENFVYLALDHCTCTLDDLIQVHSGSSNNSMLPHDPASTDDYKIKLNSVRGMMQDVNLWKHDYPSPQLLELTRDMVSGLSHLHGLRIIHRDLKPQNILIVENPKDPFLVAKLSDMGISRCLRKGKSSLGYHSTGCGTFGWHAPELIKHGGSQKSALDLFSLGCVLFFCITRGKHPLGEEVHRDSNIVKNKMDLSSVEFIPKAYDLLSRLLNQDPILRPQASEVLKHPFFWTPKMRLSFLHDVSDEVDSEAREGNFDLGNALEGIAPPVFDGNWDEKIDEVVMDDLRRHRRKPYDGSCVTDLLRAGRNKFNHRRHAPEDVKEILGSDLDGMDTYFAKLFPRLLIETYGVVHKCGKNKLIEEVLSK